MKKLVSLILAIMMIATVGAAWASSVGDLETDGIVGNFTSPDATNFSGSSVKLYKEIKVYNPETCTVNAPTITYTYAVTAGSASKTITDVETAHNPQTNVTVQTKAGLNPTSVGVTGTIGTTNNTGSLVFTPAVTMDAGPDGVSNKYPITLDFSSCGFNAAGVYRYKITETATTYGSSGVVDGTVSNERYIDVYVKDAETAGQYEIYGYVCFAYDNDIDATSSGDTSIAKAYKDEGFVAGTNTHTGTAETADQYYTFNVTIEKDLVGDQAKASNQFPFQVTFANSTVTANVLPIITKTGTSTVPTSLAATNAKAIKDYEFNGQTTTSDGQVKIADGGTVTITGIPAGTTVTINEYNDVVGTQYKVTTTGGTTNDATGKTINWNQWTSAITGWTTVTALGGTANTNAAASKNFTASDTTHSGANVKFTNTLQLISPTGYVSRFAPYALILIGGIVLLIIAKKRKPKEEEE